MEQEVLEKEVVAKTPVMSKKYRYVKSNTRRLYIHHPGFEINTTDHKGDPTTIKGKKEIIFTGGKRIMGEAKMWTNRITGGYYVTRDPLEQEAIEASKYYERGIIVLEANHDISEEPDVADAEPEQAEGITNYQQALAWLRKNKGATYEDLQSVEMLKEFAVKKNVTFPDWK